MGKKSSSFAVVWLGFLLHALAWLVPAVRGLDVNTPVFSMHKAASWAMDAPEWLPGWMGFRFAWTLLVGDEQLPEMDAARTKILGATCLTNAVMVFAFLIVLFGPRDGAHAERRLFGLLALGCTVLDASWVYLADKDMLEGLGPGYYLWVASFLVVGLGLLGTSRVPDRATSSGAA